MIETNFIKLYESSFKENWNLRALTDLNESTSYTYGELAKEVARLHVLFEQMGIKQGDKVALIGRNHSSWIIVFMATITYGAVIVPILQDYHHESIENIIFHSDVKIVFIDPEIWVKIDNEKFTLPFFAIPTFEMITGKSDEINNWKQKVNDKFSTDYPNEYRPANVKYRDIPNETVVCISYTSGTTGFSKGVMLTCDNYMGNVFSIQKFNFIFRGEKIIAFLPLAHTYGCTIDFLYNLSIGVHIHLLGNINNNQTLFDAFQAVKPNLINTVPIILEKTFERIRETIKSKPKLKIMLRIPFIRQIVYNEIRKSLISAFGGNFREVIVGGATLNKEVEDYLCKIKFPFAVGYGMTECAPLISYDNHRDVVKRSCGTVLLGTMKARIDSDDPQTFPGEIQVIGKHVMKGYYKDPEATAEAFTNDGWLRTGDLGVIDSNNRLYIKGRIKTMILGANGQNIYPEEIEARLNNMPYVSESMIIKRKNRLVGLVFPKFEEMEQKGVMLEELRKIMIANCLEVNKKLAKYEQIDHIEVWEEEFEKTPKKTMKRYLYHEN